MNVLTGVIGLPQVELRPLQEALHLHGGVTLGRHLSHYPEPAELERFLRATRPGILFISTALLNEMEAGVEHVTEHWRAIQIVVVDTGLKSSALRRAMQLGVRECLTRPY